MFSVCGIDCPVSNLASLSQKKHDKLTFDHNLSNADSFSKYFQWQISKENAYNRDFQLMLTELLH